MSTEQKAHDIWVFAGTVRMEARAFDDTQEEHDRQRVLKAISRLEGMTAELRAMCESQKPSDRGLGGDRADVSGAGGGL